MLEKKMDFRIHFGKLSVSFSACKITSKPGNIHGFLFSNSLKQNENKKIRTKKITSAQSSLFVF